MRAHAVGSVIAGLLVGLVTSFAVAEEQKGHAPHWTYGGTTGPGHWSELDPAFSACAKGKYESPIDIKAAVKAALPALQFRYAPAPLTIVDNGHTVMATYAPGSTLAIGERTYELKQLHFHHPSEESIHSKRFAMVAPLVHEDAERHIAVVAVLLKAGRGNPLIASLWKNLPAEKGRPASVAGVSIDARGILPSSLGYYSFEGSLTTPPCTEHVTWYILKTPMELSPAQLAAFAKLYPLNARPLQPVNGRKILETE